ncbi:DMT family transporter [Desulforhopalus sp. IMCC35007]|uniref:DMT family transporter n=1 Tax=Desulforhopalus sp. IMCC35007 TaxID=2569543 RepID=UPI0010ADC322|nr:DMT family transporter [Desulforhopalus sp. IMCC35007]TKB09961.1 DMT family transporter [Desulforhopalus sp. IMCC35007]
MTRLSRLYSPIFCVLCGAFLISFSGIFVKFAHVSPTASGFYRTFFGAVFLLAATLLQREYHRPALGQLGLVIFCGLTFALDLFFWHESIMYIGPGLATLIGNFQVFLLAGVGIIFLGEKSKLRFIISIPLAVAGLYLIIGTNWSTLDTNYQTGILFALFTACFYTVFLLSLRKVQAARGTSFFFLLLLVSIFTAIFLGAKMLYSGDSFTIPDSQSLLALLGLGLFSQTIGWALIATAMPKIPASLTGLTLLLQPTLAFIWDVLIFDRPTGPINWLGVTITLLAIYMGITGKITRRQESEALHSSDTEL